MKFCTIIFILLCLLRALKARQRLMALKSLPNGIANPAGAPGPPPLARLLAVEGAQLDPGTLRAADAWMAQHHLEILDLVPGRAPCETALQWADALQLGDAERTRFDRGSSAGYALLVSRNVWTRAGLKVQSQSPLSPAALDDLAAELKRFANKAFGHVVVPSCEAPARSVKDVAAALRKAGVGSAVFLCARMAVLASLGCLALVRPAWAAAALLSYHVIPALALAGTQIHARDLLLQTFCRSLLQLVRTFRLLMHWRDETEADREIARLRTLYADLLAQHPDQEREPRAEACPICAAPELGPFLKAGDLAQGKPGEFSLDRCRTCGHIFQNPRLNFRGLSFYYQDYYDGLGAETSEKWYAGMTKTYASRAACVRKLCEGSQPQTSLDTWLDVGLGQGHFCCFARDVFPQTRFHGIDRNENVSLAKQRGWIDEAFGEQFTDFAAGHANQYDVVSLFQYLEHTVMPLEELKAAHTVLKPGGTLIIEIPNPQFRLSRILGQFWIPWMQPQHLHFFSADNLARVLSQNGFVEVQRDFREMHTPTDLLWSLGLILRRWAPLSPAPWRKQTSPVRLIFNLTVWTAALPLFLVATAVDHLTALKKTGASCSNHFRLVAKKVG